MYKLGQTVIVENPGSSDSYETPILKDGVPLACGYGVTPGQSVQDAYRIISSLRSK